MRANQLVGVAGTNGSGKDTIMRYLSERYEYLFLAATDMLANELTRQGKELTRENKAALSAQWRREQGMGVIVQRAYEEFMLQATTYTGLTVGSLRHPGEADAIHELGGLMIWVDADPRVRYDRLQANDRGRAAEDRISFEQFKAEEEREMHHTGDAATLDGAAVKKRCDIFISNDQDSIGAFEKHVSEALGLE